MRTPRRGELLLIVALLMILVGCADGTQSASPVAPSSAAVTATASICPVTVPNGSIPPGERADPTHYGNGSLWVDLWPNGVVHARPGDVSPDGSIIVKFGWWRAVRGPLSIEGYRLDGPASASWENIPDGYGDIGFQSTAISFPTVGCWEVAGTVGASQLSFVTLVQRG